MNCFRGFTVPLWKVFSGNLLMLTAIVFYITWWTAAFRSNGGYRTARAIFFISLALLAGVAAIMTLSLGIKSLASPGKSYPVTYILLGAVVLYILLVVITKIGFQRPVTSELLLITIWGALEGSAIAVLRSNDRFSLVQTLTLAALVLLATCTGIVCYILYYRLDEVTRFWNGLIPLIADAGVVTVFLTVLALS